MRTLNRINEDIPDASAQNVLFGLRRQKLSAAEKRDIIERCLKEAALWDEVSRRLDIAQAKRISDTVVFLCDGQVVEHGAKTDIFSRRSSDKTRTYITEEFCDC